MDIKIYQKLNSNYHVLINVRVKNDGNYEFKDILIERLFLFKTIQETNEKLTKNKEEFLIDLGDMVRNFLDDQTLFYWEEKGYFYFGTNALNIK